MCIDTFRIRKGSHQYPSLALALGFYTLQYPQYPEIVWEASQDSTVLDFGMLTRVPRLRPTRLASRSCFSDDRRCRWDVMMLWSVWRCLQPLVQIHAIIFERERGHLKILKKHDDGLCWGEQGHSLNNNYFGTSHDVVRSSNMA